MKMPIVKQHRPLAANQAVITLRLVRSTANICKINMPLGQDEASRSPISILVGRIHKRLHDANAHRLVPAWRPRFSLPFLPYQF